MTEIEQLFAEAASLQQAGKFDEAERKYQVLLEQEPRHGQALHMRGILAAQQGQYALAKDYLLQALDSVPFSPAIHNHLGNVLKSLKDYPAAIDHFKLAIEHQPGFAQAYNNLGNIYYLQQEWQQAIHYYQQALEHQPDYIDALKNLILGYMQLKDVQKIEENLKKLFLLDQDNEFANYHLGNLAYQQGNYSQAIDYYLRVIAIHPDYIDAQLNLGVCYLRVGKEEDAICTLEKILMFEPSHVLANLNLAHICFNKSDYAKAKQYYQVLLNDPAEQYNANFQLGIIFMKEKKWEYAQAYFEKVLAMNEQDASAHNNLATISLKLGDKQLAEQHYKKVLDLEPDNRIALYRLQTLTHEGEIEKAPNEYVTALFDDYAQTFDLELIDKLNYRLPDTLYQALQGYLPEQASWVIADLGCGTGLAARLLVKHAQHLLGIDISKNMLKIAADKAYYHELVCGDFHLILENNPLKFDLILAADVFVYLGNLQPIFSIVAKKLQAQGLFVFTVEKSVESDYQLTSSGRFTHSKDYIFRLAKEYKLAVEVSDLIILRKQLGEEVQGYLFILQNIP